MKNIQQNREESPINYELIYTMYYTLAKVSTEDKEEKGYGLFEKLDKNAFIKSLGENEFDEKTLDLMYTLSCSDKIESTDIQKYIEDNIQSLKKDMTQQQLKVAKVMGKKNDKWSELSNRTKDIVRQGIYSGKDIKNIFKTKEKIQEKEKYFDVEQTYGIDGINECTALIILNILENCKNNREITQETLQQLIEQGDITKDQSQEWQETAEQISRIWQGKLKNIDSER